MEDKYRLLGTGYWQPREIPPDFTGVEIYKSNSKIAKTGPQEALYFHARHIKIPQLINYSKMRYNQLSKLDDMVGAFLVMNIYKRERLIYRITLPPREYKIMTLIAYYVLGTLDYVDNYVVLIDNVPSLAYQEQKDIEEYWSIITSDQNVLSMNEFEQYESDSSKISPHDFKMRDNVLYILGRNKKKYKHTYFAFGPDVRNELYTLRISMHISMQDILM